MNFPKDLLELDEDFSLGIDYFALKGIPRAKYTAITKTEKPSNIIKTNKPISAIERAILTTKIASLSTETSASASNLQSKQRETPINTKPKPPIIESNKENRVDPRKPPRKPEEKQKESSVNLPKYTSQKITSLKVEPDPVVRAARDKSKTTANQRARSMFNRSNTSNPKSGINISMNESFETERELILEKKLKKDLSVLFINPAAFQRHGVPYFIAHFEGVLGTIYHNLPAALKQSPEKYLLRANLKKEFRLISKNFIIIIIFPLDNERYKRMLRYMLKNQFCIDGAYYITKNAKETRKSPFLLDYSQIVSDFRIRSSNKVLIMQSIDDSGREIKSKVRQVRKQIKPNIQLDEPKNIAAFYRKFPVAKISPEDLRILMIPNFYLDGKYERLSLSPAQIGSRVITNCLNYVHQNHFNNEDEANLSTNTDQHVSKQDVSSQDSRNETEMIINRKELDQNSSPASRIYTEGSKAINVSEIENKPIQAISLVELFHLDFQKVANAMDKDHRRDALVKEFGNIKKNNSSLQDRPKASFDTALMRNRITNHLSRKYGGNDFGKNIGEYLQIGDLISRNSAIIAEIENEEYMKNPNHSANLKAIINLLENEKESRVQQSESDRKNVLSSRNKKAEEDAKPAPNYSELEKKFLDCFILCYSE